jgi:mono/diheme cytochrome c family protein
MRNLLRWTGYGLGGLAALALLATLGVFGMSQWVLSRGHAAVPEQLRPASPAELADAPRQAKILGCVSCHGANLGGREFLDVPNVVRIYAPNIPSIAARSTDQQLARAIRQGIGHDGRNLFVMPSASYQRLSDGEVSALIAYIRSLPPGAGSTEGFSARPIGRFAIAAGKLRPQVAKLDEYRLQGPIPAGAQHKAGQNLAGKYCADCHGPALDGLTMESGEVTPNLTLAGAYDFDQFRTLMRTGKAAGNREVGLMSTVARDDFSHLNDAELRSIHGYLKARSEKVGS